MNDKTLFERKNDLFLDSNIGMYYCGRRENTLNHVYGPEIRNHYLFVLVNKGSAVLHSENNMEFHEHDLLVMCPGEKIYYRALTPWSIQWVGLYGDTVSEYVTQLGINGRNPIFSVSLWTELELLLDRMYTLSADFSISGKLIMTSLIYQFFSILFQCAKIKEETDYVQIAKNIIDYNFSNDISIEALAQDLHLSASYFTRIFTGTLGTSPKQYLLQQRIHRAKELLKTTNASILEIANSVGIPDQLYFSRIFKKKVGLSPLEYRKQQQ